MGQVEDREKTVAALESIAKSFERIVSLIEEVRADGKKKEAAWEASLRGPT